MKKIMMIVVLTVLTMACSSDDSLEIENVDFSVLSKANLFGAGDEGIVKENLIITDNETWTDLLSKMDTVNNVSDTFTETTIDFSIYTVIAVFDEVKGNGGFEVALEITTDSESVFVNRIDEAPQGNVTTVITQPYSIVKIAKTDLPIVFEE